MKKVLALIFIVSLLLLAGCTKEAPKTPVSKLPVNTNKVVDTPVDSGTEAEVIDVEADLEELDSLDVDLDSDLDSLDADLDFEI
ncbi:hypothetical protein ACFL0V_03100 [Nanoarchaeota archaeon]